MRAVMLEVPQSLLDERRRTGADRWDELWEGELHMVPPPPGEHQEVGSELFAVLFPLARGLGLRALYDGTGLFRPGVDDDYRIPDHTYTRPEHRTPRGVDGPAELVVEIRSPGDETYEKLGFYADLGVGEVLVVQPEERAVELFRLHDGQVLPVHPDDEGRVHCEALDVDFRTVDGPRLPALACAPRPAAGASGTDLRSARCGGPLGPGLPALACAPRPAAGASGTDLRSARCGGPLGPRLLVTWQDGSAEI